MTRRGIAPLAWLYVACLLACGEPARDEQPAAPKTGAAPAASAEAAPAQPEGPDRAAIRERAAAYFMVLPEEAENADDPVTDERVFLGRLLYFDPRLSKNHDVSCNSCHPLDRFGADGEPTSEGHRGQRGVRNAPSVYNAAFHLAQFWDGRAADVEEQASGPVTNPVEMAMPSEEAVTAVLRSIPDYVPLFESAFPDEEEPISLRNAARAIGAFERRLTTPSRFDHFLAGDEGALTDAEVEGLVTFMDVGCTSCHNGVAVGGALYQKLGLVKPYPSEDPGRFEVTGNEADRGYFKVPSLRNVQRTGPYLHDGSVTSLEQMIRIMGEHQLGRTLTDEQVASIRVFLWALTGRPNAVFTQHPVLPPDGPDTPAPDPT